MKVSAPKLNIDSRKRVAFLLICIVIASTFLAGKSLLKRPDPKTDLMRLSASLMPKENAKQFNLQIAVNFARTKRWESAMQIFQEILAQEPTNVGILNNMAYVAGEQGDFAKANEYLETALRIGEKCAECYNNLGALHYRQGKLPEATQAFEKAAQLETQYLEPRLNLAVILEEQSNWLESLRYYQEAEALITDVAMKKAISMRALWMSEIAQGSKRQIAGEK